MKKLTELTLAEYTNLNKIGFLFEIYPLATGSYKNDVELVNLIPKEVGEYEVYGMWYRCPFCGEANLIKDYDYCPDCGKEVFWVDWKDKI